MGALAVRLMEAGKSRTNVRTLAAKDIEAYTTFCGGHPPALPCESFRVGSRL